LIVEHYEEKLAAAREDAERQFNIVTDMLVEQASLLTQYEEKLAAVREAASLVCETAVEVPGMGYCEVYTTHVDALRAAVAKAQEDA
jgi:hypothetical protein